MTIVDIHCHTFNADDLPVRGFVRRTRFDDARIGDIVGALSDKYLQTRAPDYADERRKLDRMLGVAGEQEGPVGLDLAAGDLVDEFEDDVERTMRELDLADPALLAELGAELAAAEAGEEEGLLDAARAARRIVRWIKLFRQYRVTNTALLVDNFADAVDLYTPLVVDLDAGSHDKAGTSIREQVELHEKIARLSMLGLVDRTERGRIHPFVGFDPRREVLDRRSREIDTAFDVVKAAIERYGFVGVKVYPPMGFKPIGNGPTVDMDDQMAREVDDVLTDLYTWCEAEDVPITAHCAQSNEAHDSYIDFSDPAFWAAVLAAHPGLHLNLGHFGGAAATVPRQAWPWQIAALATDDHPFLFADVGNHKIYDDELRNGYFAMLEEMFDAGETEGMAGRIMYGSDWFMLAAHKEHDEFLERYRTTYEARFGADRTRSFMGEAALRFLGFDDPANKNTLRLRAYYERFAPHRMPGWLAG